MRPCQWWAESAPLGWNRVKVSENLGATAVALVAPVDTSLLYYWLEINCFSQIHTAWTFNEVLVDPYPFIAVKRVWIDQNIKGYGSTKTSLTVHTVWSKKRSFKIHFLIYSTDNFFYQYLVLKSIAYVPRVLRHNINLLNYFLIYFLRAQFCCAAPPIGISIDAPQWP